MSTTSFDRPPGSSQNRTFVTGTAGQSCSEIARVPDFIDHVVAVATNGDDLDVAFLRRTANWYSGAVAEQAVATSLAHGLADSGAIVLHDRSASDGSKSNIDHIVVTRYGIAVIDTKTADGKVRSGMDTLFVGKVSYAEDLSRATRTADHIARSVAFGSHLVGVVPMLCLVNADWGRSAPPFEVGDVSVVSPGRVVKCLADRAARSAEHHSTTTSLFTSE
jgi:hypothetical protein